MLIRSFSSSRITVLPSCFISATILFSCLTSSSASSSSSFAFVQFPSANSRRFDARHCHSTPIINKNNIIQRSMTSTTTTTSPLPVENPLETMGLPSPILLGSASFTRKLILKEMGIPFIKCVRPIDEKGLGDRSQDLPTDLVMTLAKAKMDYLIQEIQAGHCQEELSSSSSYSNHGGDEWIVLTGDQVVTCNGKILEKPESIEEAREFVASYQTNPPSTVGSCVLTHLPTGIQVSGVDTATIYFSTSVPTDLVDRLVELDEPILSCAGGLMIEHPLTKEHVTRIDGTEDSVMGLSKDLVLRLLQELKTKLDALS